MSSGQKRVHSLAYLDAEAFARLLAGPGVLLGETPVTHRWQFAGSVRRAKPEVGDVDHVVIPRWGNVAVGEGLFPEERFVNLLWHVLDTLVAKGTLQKALHRRGDGEATRWGDRQRSVLFNGFVHEIWTADPANWGGTLAIRTGPETLSKRLVNGLRENGYLQDGHVLSLTDFECSCGWKGPSPRWTPVDRLAAYPGAIASGQDPTGTVAHCPHCGSAKQLARVRVPVADERKYFELAGIPWITPEARR